MEAKIAEMVIISKKDKFLSIESLKGLLTSSRGNTPKYLQLDSPNKPRVQLVVSL